MIAPILATVIYIYIFQKQATHLNSRQDLQCLTGR